MNAHFIFGSLSVAFSITSTLFFLVGITRQAAKPHFISWLIWAITTGVALAAQLTSHAGPGAWVTTLSTLQCVIFAVYGFFYGEKTITRGDWLTFLFSLLAIPLWVLTHNPLCSVLLVTLIDLAGYYPTFRKTWGKPYDEPPYAYAFSAAALATSILALNNFVMANWIYSGACCLANFSLAAVIIIRRQTHTKP